MKDYRKYKLGVVPDKIDERDYTFKAISSQIELPDSVDLRPDFPSVFSQNSQGSCTSNCGIGVLEYLFYVLLGKKLILSRQYLYNMERINDKCPLHIDNGSSMRQICHTLNKNGVCLEELFTYGNGNEKIEPNDKAKANAQKYRIKSYHRCENANDIKMALAQGFPVLAGIEIYNSFYNTKSDGIIPKINKAENQCLGGHAVVLAGYKSNNKKGLFGKKETYYILRNSWGVSEKTEDSWGYAFNNPSDSGFGENGYGYISESNLMNILMDSWVITEVENID